MPVTSCGSCWQGLLRSVNARIITCQTQQLELLLSAREKTCIPLHIGCIYEANKLSVFKECLCSKTSTLGQRAERLLLNPEITIKSILQSCKMGQGSSPSFSNDSVKNTQHQPSSSTSLLLTPGPGDNFMEPKQGVLVRGTSTSTYMVMVIYVAM